MPYRQPDFYPESIMFSRHYGQYGFDHCVEMLHTRKQNGRLISTAHRKFYPSVIPADGSIAGYLPAPKADADEEKPVELLTLMPDVTLGGLSFSPEEPAELPLMPETPVQKLQRVYKKALHMAVQAGVASECVVTGVTINNRLTRAWGRCITKVQSGKVLNCRIDVRRSLVECEHEEPLLYTLLHELCHTVKNGWRGHKDGFLTAARKIDEMYGLSIARATVSYKQYGL